MKTQMQTLYSCHQQVAFFLVPSPGNQKFFGGYAAMFFAFFGYRRRGPR